MKNYWLSWHQPTEDYRPLTYPPTKSILGWWCTGTCERDAILCAMVRAPSGEIAKELVKLDWPEAKTWRFCEEKKEIKFSDRFPLTDWMEERIKRINGSVA